MIYNKDSVSKKKFFVTLQLEMMHPLWSVSKTILQYCEAENWCCLQLIANILIFVLIKLTWTESLENILVDNCASFLDCSCHGSGSGSECKVETEAMSIYFGKLLTTDGAGADATQKLSKTKSVWVIVKIIGDCI